MNLDNAREAERLLIDQPDEKFDMRTYFRPLDAELFWRAGSADDLALAVYRWGAHPCNTACCFAGLIQMHKAETSEAKELGAFSFARDWLDIPWQEAQWLFMPLQYAELPNTGPITKDNVLARLRWLIAYEEAEAENTYRSLMDDGNPNDTARELGGFLLDHGATDEEV